MDVSKENNNLWIFGYGSLVWRPDFVYKSSKVGFIMGYKRRFWHGDDFHRGNKTRPGRVVTLVDDPETCTWGVAYEVSKSQVESSLQSLHKREVELGGYRMKTVNFFPKDGKSPLLALVYIATSDNPSYLGPASDRDIAAQIAICRGNNGANIEYLLRLAEFMRLCCPEVEDEHLFSIEAAALNFFRGPDEMKYTSETPDAGSYMLNYILHSTS
ncbi:glutathione-specific gamma-glutamylcyclotransferase 1-like [Antennarius striatus]|uniref:glutathione-specific gamma-glutamylcyclotransferase 1-like n=1 Tax=Antennarius striatus TaxID=241820 RepID=UPI0035AF6C56